MLRVPRVLPWRGSKAARGATHARFFPMAAWADVVAELRRDASSGVAVACVHSASGTFHAEKLRVAGYVTTAGAKAWVMSRDQLQRLYLAGDTPAAFAWTPAQADADIFTLARPGFCTQLFVSDSATGAMLGVPAVVWCDFTEEPGTVMIPVRPGTAAPVPAAATVTTTLTTTLTTTTVTNTVTTMIFISQGNAAATLKILDDARHAKAQARQHQHRHRHQHRASPHRPPKPKPSPHGQGHQPAPSPQQQGLVAAGT